MTTNLTKANLAQFYGTEQYHRYTGDLVLTDGAAFLVRNGAKWLVDVIASARVDPKVRREPFEAWSVQVDLATSTAVVTCTDGGKEGRQPIRLFRQTIIGTDFPLESIELYAISDEGLGAKVVMLTSEY